MVTRAIIVAVLALAAPDGASCLAAGASKFNLDVLPAEQCLPGAEPSHTLQGEDFYLVALEKK